MFCFEQSKLNKLFGGFLCKDVNDEKQKQNEPENHELMEITEMRNGAPVDKPLKKNKNGLFRKIKKLLKTAFKFLICTKIGKFLTIGLYGVYLGLSIWSAINIREGINLADLVSEDSYYSSYINDNSKLTDLTPIVMFVVKEPINYDSAAIRMKLQNLVSDAYKIDGISKSFKLNWIDNFGNEKIKYKKSLKKLFKVLKPFPPFLNDLIIHKIETSYDSKTNLSSIKKTVFNYNDYEKFDLDDESEPSSDPNHQVEYQISASRFYLQYDKLHFSSQDAKPMHLLRKLCSESELPIIPYSITFKFYEQFEQTLPNVLQAFLISIEAMYLIALIFIPDLISVFCIIFSMGSIMIGLIGLMNAWNLTLSSVTMIELIMSVGFCVDFTAHIAHAFIAGVGKGSRSRRAYKSLLRVGFPIFNSALSTIIGISLLAFSKSYMFISFFKTMSILMVLGLLNSLLFLPVLLSIVGPNWPRHKMPKSQDENEKTILIRIIIDFF